MGHMTMCLFNLFTAFGERWISQSLLKSLYFQKNGMTDYDSRWSCCVVSLRHLELMQLHRPELKVGQGTERKPSVLRNQRFALHWVLSGQLRFLGSRNWILDVASRQPQSGFESFGLPAFRFSWCLM